MKVTLIGCGCGKETLTAEAMNMVRRSGLLIGAPRVLEQFQENNAVKIPAMSTREIIAALSEQTCEEACVLFSGDSGFYSGARLLMPMLPKEWEWHVLPGISSMQAFAARLGEPWQDWRLCSAHGVECDPVAEVCREQKVFFLTGGKTGPAEICEQLKEAGLDRLRVAAGENLGTNEERILFGSAGEFAKMQFAPLSVLLAAAAPRVRQRAPGLPDKLFEREEKIPMTKQTTRTAVLAALGAGPEDICWDIGAGSGSVAIELALQTRAVWAVEQKPEALTLAARNREKLGAWNLRLVEGTAPAALKNLPAPDAVFVGGSGGRLREILYAVHEKNPAARICVSAIALETLQCAADTLRELNDEVEITQIAVCRSRAVGELTMMQAQNPVFLITGRQI